MHWKGIVESDAVVRRLRLRPSVHLFLLLALPLPLLVCAPSARAQECDDWRAELLVAEGNVEVRRAGQTLWAPAFAGDVFCVDDAVRTLDFSRATLLLFDETKERLDQNTTIIFPAGEDGERSLIELLLGVIHAISREPRMHRVLTPFANAGIEGTEFLVRVTGDQTDVIVIEGAVLVSNAAGQVSVGSGERAIARAGQAPVVQVIVRPFDAVQWALYYEPVLQEQALAPDDAPTADQASDGAFFAARAGRRLAVGQIDAAREDIATSLRLDPGNSDALALESIIALTQNDKQAAMDFANRAVAAAPDSAAALLALSYAQQAFFDVPAAVSTLERATGANPQNALAWSRLSEMLLAVGELDRGLNAAQTAAAIDSSVARTQTVLGFASLTQIDIEAAAQAFRNAIALDPASPLPRLGLGLTLIRNGELEAGRIEIETAVILDPANALTRSYMGKAYYEEKRNALAASQYALAQDLDPLDPTPYLYDAIRRQTENLPVEALETLARAIELNDNRGVYRSRLLLDEDLAVRSASLARIFRDVGFEQTALVEGWKSVAADPSDYSGHRFLADIYSQQPRHQIARVNELFRAQMLQPLNLTPIPAQLAELNPFILDSAGPADLAFNEFNPAFNRNRFAIQGSAVAGSNGTRGGDIVVSGINDKLSYSVSQFHFETDGFRDNNDFEQDAFNAFVQYRPAFRTSIQAELRSSETDKGDLTQLFDPFNFSTSLRQLEDMDSARIGMRHSFSPASDLLTSLTYQKLEATSSTLPTFFAFTKLDGLTLDIQHLYRADRWQVTSGVIQVSDDFDSTVEISRVLPFPPFIDESTTRTLIDVEMSTAYVYTDIEATGNLTLTLGVSHDSLDGASRDRDQTNPKFGLMWEVTRDTMIRAAVFRTLQGPLVSRQHIVPRLEPTQVAGFNQFFFGPESESVERAGIGVDHGFSDRLYAGVEISQRDIEFPFIDFTSLPPAPIFVDVTEELGLLYVNWAPTSRLAVSAEYQSEDQDNNGRALTDLSTRLETERLPVEIRYFHPLGLSASLRTTVVDQRGAFLDQSVPPPFPLVEDQESFHVVDASISYRLPGRRGIVSLQIGNLFDETFRFQDTDTENPGLLPERTVLLKFTGAY